MPELDVIAHNAQSAHEAVTEGWRVAKALTADGKAVHITVKEDEDQRSLQQNRYYFGPFLGAISEQVRTPDRWMPEAWHQLGRRKFLGYEIKKEIVAGKKRPVVIRRLRSTRDLTEKQFARYLEEFTAYATVELHVEFPA